MQCGSYFFDRAIMLFSILQCFTYTLGRRQAALSLPSFPETNGDERSGDIAHPALSRQQVKLCRRIPRVLYLQPYAQIVEVFADRGRNGSHGGTCANDEEICATLDGLFQR
jgi:hypothetical protein